MEGRLQLLLDKDYGRIRKLEAAARQQYSDAENHPEQRVQREGERNRIFCLTEPVGENVFGRFMTIRPSGTFATSAAPIMSCGCVFLRSR